MSQITLTDRLAVVLAETYTVYLQTQNFHWNVVGEQFFGLHAAFQEQYEELAQAIDEIAEQIRQLGEFAPGSFAEFATLSSFAHIDADAIEYSDSGAWRKMVAVLIDQHEALLVTLSEAQVVASAAEDEATLDLLVTRQRAHSKFVWMLHSVQQG